MGWGDGPHGQPKRIVSVKLENAGQRARGGGGGEERADGLCGRWHPNVRDQG